MQTEEVWKKQQDAIDWFKDLGGDAWMPLYLPGEQGLLPGEESRYLWSCLLSPASIDHEMQRFGFDQFDGYPATGEFEGDTNTSHYSRYGEEDREPIFFRRHFPTLSPYLEVSQEFVHFFRLHENRRTGEFVREADDGSEEVVLKFEDGGIWVKAHALRQFLAFKEMVLVVGLDNKRKFEGDLVLEDQAVQEGRFLEEQVGTLNYFVSFWQSVHDGKGNTRLLSKKIIFPIPIEKTGIFPFEKPEKFEEFIVGVDKEGHEISCTCNPDKLDNLFGKNPGAPNFLTPVFFSKEVLDRYYSRPEKYRVEDGGIWIGGCYLQADTNHPQYVIVYLGDLGGDITFSEQQYWRRFNIPPDGEMSQTNYERSILGEFASPEALNFVFIEKLLALQKIWPDKFDWGLIKPLAQEDEYRLSTLRTPARGNQKGFDEAITGLNIILVESLNSTGIGSALNSGSIAISKDDKSIDKLEKFLAMEYPGEGSDVQIKFLRTLQKLRSRGGAHRKSREEYQDEMRTLGFADIDFSQGFENLLQQAIEFLDFFIQLAESK